jgi:uncharacterized protein YecE (DUF72 family)
LAAMIWIGTSGFQYPEWKGLFYPEKISTAKMLPYYAERFPTTEINYTFNRIPTVKVLDHWASVTPENFRFSLKAPKLITHIKKLQGTDSILGEFWNVAKTLNDRLAIVLFQLPPWFRKDVTVLKKFLGSMPRGLKVTFEFRHESWFDEEVYATLRSKNAALCIADSEKLSTPTVMTANFGYFRLRDVGYRPADIKRWAKIISEHTKKADDIYVYFKHEETGTGPKFAEALRNELG